jgi:hypothetical protein
VATITMAVVVASRDILYAVVSPDGTSDTEGIVGYTVNQAGTVNQLPGFPISTGGEGNTATRRRAIVAIALVTALTNHVLGGQSQYLERLSRCMCRDVTTDAKAESAIVAAPSRR